MNKVESGRKRKKFSISTLLALIISYVVIFIAFSIASPYFFSLKNMQNIIVYSTTVGLIAASMTFVIIMGSLDISVGSILALSGVTAAMGAQVFGTPGGIVAAILTGAACGAVNAFLVAVIKINPFITTLATSNIFRGLAYILTNGYAIQVYDSSFLKIGQGRIFGIQTQVYILIIAFCLMGYILKNTTFGRDVYSVGGNSTASFLSGIKVSKVRFMVYTLSGICGGLAGIMLTAQTGTGMPQAAQDTNMDAISSVILGGTALSGGRGGMIGTVIGVLMLSTLSNGMVLLNIPSFYQMVLKGIILLLAVVIDVVKGAGAYK